VLCCWWVFGGLWFISSCMFILNATVFFISLCAMISG
jgi:hypothetical protein